MPEEYVESVVHYADGKLWIQPERRSRPTHDEEVLERARAIAAEVDELDTWPAAYLEHEPGECLECDAVRLLDEISMQLQDSAEIDDLRAALAAHA